MLYGHLKRVYHSDFYILVKPALLFPANSFSEQSAIFQIFRMKEKIIQISRSESNIKSIFSVNFSHNSFSFEIRRKT